MSPYRQPALKYATPKRLKTSLKRKIKFAWDRANYPGNKFWLILIHSFVCITFIIFEKNSAIAAIEMATVVALITIARMLWSWCSFFIQAKQRNKRAKRMDELQNYKTFGFVSLPTGTNHSYKCGNCKERFRCKSASNASHI